jgi:hypothetical protein
MTDELTKDWLLIVWNRKPGVLLRKQGMLALDVFKGHITPEIKTAVTCCSMNTDLVVIPPGLLHICRCYMW